MININLKSTKLKPIFFYLLFIAQAVVPSNSMAQSNAKSVTQCKALFRSTYQVETLKIKSARLIIQPIATNKPHEIEKIKKIWTDPLVQETSGDYLSIDEVIRDLLAGQKTYLEATSDKPTYINFALLLNGEPIGVLQLTDATREPDLKKIIKASAGKKWLEVSYHLLPKYWRKGFASEAVEEVVNFAKKELNGFGFYANTLNENIGSQKVLENLNFIEIPSSDKRRKKFILKQD